MTATFVPSALLLLLLLAALLVGLFLFYRGWRGVPQFSAPQCAKCRYDLRASAFASDQPRRCPECGADLSAPYAVRFGDYRRRPGLMLIGAGVACVPLFLILATFLIRSSSMGGARLRSTAAILASLPQTVAQPWDWQELEQRLTANALSNAQVKAAIGVLITHLQQERAKGVAPSPLPWSGNFVKLAIGKGALAPADVIALGQAFYGLTPGVRTFTRCRAGAALEVQIDDNNPWNLPGARCVWALRDVQLDGRPLPRPPVLYRAPEIARHPDLLSGGQSDQRAVGVALPADLSPGAHELAFAFDVGVLPDNLPFRGLEGKPGPAAKWPQPLATWAASVTCKVTVVAPPEPLVALVEDPASAPPPGALGVQRILVAPAAAGKVRVNIEWKSGPAGPVALCYRVTLRGGGRDYPFGTFQRSDRGSSSTSSSELAGLPADLKQVDVILTPDPKAAESSMGVERIWGEPATIPNVRLDRADLEMPAP